MNIRAWHLLVAAVAGLGLWFFWLRDPGYDCANLPPSARGPWVAFGDSLTEGYGASEGKDYPSVLGRSLGVKILNFGRSGDTTGDALQRVEAVAQLEPRVVLLCLGGNDGLQKLSPSRMLANLGHLIDRFQAQGSFVVLIGVRSATVRDRYEKPFRQLARAKRAFYVKNILRDVFLKPIYMSDALHPNDEGYRLIAERLATELRPLLPQLGQF